ncbi:M23 family metallopeptidase [Geoalkalibacter halelectricus]|uniref:M23 family metallopeptidase n=1 Tax=Geoalkalibacter halelectricus TaxID=2847045 RepID=A0ABY5ZPW2_9BACT|nr:M23 family metallopeptidase [Geoalkalibacter halelectricus]MDO3376939.1 M23 family metallopeptidase [Geoalkalibacter halelectricus]UWZ81163.1 M23 family metallopeptidase [Geoalkalibacter halelectricus]
MNRLILAGLLIVVLATGAAAGQWSLRPQVIDNGGAALLVWEGPQPVSGVAHFAEQVFPLAPRSFGAVALLAADLDLPAGTYPVDLSLKMPDGKIRTHLLHLEVRHLDRAVQRLTLPPSQVTPHEPEVLERIERERQRFNQVFAHTSLPVLWQEFVRPVDDPTGSPFGVRRILNDQPRAPHSGVDFRSPRGTSVRAAARGRVVMADDFFFTGKTVVLDHGGGLYSLYAHLEQISCAEGDLLEAGSLLGRVGSTGRSTGPHLHWGVRLQNQRIDPLVLLELLPGRQSDYP